MNVADSQKAGRGGEASRDTNADQAPSNNMCNNYVTLNAIRMENMRKNKEQTSKTNGERPWRNAPQRNAGCLRRLPAGTIFAMLIITEIRLFCAGRSACLLFVALVCIGGQVTESVERSMYWHPWNPWLGSHFRARAVSLLNWLRCTRAATTAKRISENMVMTCKCEQQTAKWSTHTHEQWPNWPTPSTMISLLN